MRHKVRGWHFCQIGNELLFFNGRAEYWVVSEEITNCIQSKYQRQQK